MRDSTDSAVTQSPAPDPGDGSIRVEVEASTLVATITIDRPAKLNAVTPAMATELVRVVRWCNQEDSVRAVVLTGAGEKAFCCGSDISTLDSYATPWDFRNREDYCDALRQLRTPLVAAINGYALGGGLELALACDIRLVSTRAKLGAPEVKLGWIGGGGMAATLSRAAGPGNAALMLMTGDPIDAEQAVRWQLAAQAFAPQDLLPRAQQLAATIAARAPIAVETAKVNLRAAAAMSQEQALEYERDLQTICFATADAAEGRAAFAQKRNPSFGRR